MSEPRDTATVEAAEPPVMEAWKWEMLVSLLGEAVHATTGDSRSNDWFVLMAAQHVVRDRKNAASTPSVPDASEYWA